MTYKRNQESIMATADATRSLGIIYVCGLGIFILSFIPIFILSLSLNNTLPILCWPVLFVLFHLLVAFTAINVILKQEKILRLQSCFVMLLSYTIYILCNLTKGDHSLRCAGC